jgi:hypothetical protein
MTSAEHREQERRRGAGAPTPADQPGGDRTIATFLRFVRLLILAALLLPFIIVACTRLMGYGVGTPTIFWVPVAGLAGLAVVGARGLGLHLERRLCPALQVLGEAQARYVDELPRARVPLAIAVSAGLSLFLELAVIRWHGSVWEVFAFYKNFSLLGCFLGLGLGYALAGRSQLSAIAALPLLAFQVVYLIALRHAVPIEWLGMRATPILGSSTWGGSGGGCRSTWRPIAFSRRRAAVHQLARSGRPAWVACWTGPRSRPRVEPAGSLAGVTSCS